MGEFKWYRLWAGQIMGRQAPDKLHGGKLRWGKGQDQGRIGRRGNVGIWGCLIPLFWHHPAPQAWRGQHQMLPVQDPKTRGLGIPPETRTQPSSVRLPIRNPLPKQNAQPLSHSLQKPSQVAARQLNRDRHRPESKRPQRSASTALLSCVW